MSPPVENTCDGRAGAAGLEFPRGSFRSQGEFGLAGGALSHAGPVAKASGRVAGGHVEICDSWSSVPLGPLGFESV
jgi:hypothetical protein